MVGTASSKSLDFALTQVSSARQLCSKQSGVKCFEHNTELFEIVGSTREIFDSHSFLRFLSLGSPW